MNLSSELSQLIREEILTNIDVISSRDNLKVFKINGYATNSVYYPKKEAKKITEGYYKKHHFHILLGIGSGYIAEELYSTLQEHEKLLIIEPNEKLVEKISSFQFLYDNENVKIISGFCFEQLDNYLTSIITQYNNRIQIIISPNYEKLYPHFIKQVMLAIKEVMMLEVVDRNTISHFTDNWQENFIKNLYFSYKSIPFEYLKNKLNCPIVIASGGPSLFKQLPIIRKNRKKFFLLCAGSTINTLLSVGIVPDGIVSIDGKSALHFEGIENFDIPLFYSATLQNEVLKIHKGEKIIFKNKGHDQSGKIMEELLNCDIGQVVGGGSVANFALDIACKLTTGPICLIGQDLAYTNNSTHAKGNKRYSLIDKELIEEKKMFRIKGYYGDDILTDFPFLSMKRSFESYIVYLNQLEGNNRVYNCTEGGALIENCINKPFTSFLEQYCQQETSLCFNSLLKDLKINRSKVQWQRLYDFFKEEKKKSMRVSNLCDEALKILRNIDNNQPNFSNVILKRLRKLDNRLKKLLDNEILFYLLGEVVFNLNNLFLDKVGESKEEMEMRIYLKSLALYDGIQSATEKSIVWYSELLDSLSKELSME